MVIFILYFDVENGQKLSWKHNDENNISHEFDSC